MKDLPFVLVWSVILVPLLTLCFIVGSDHLLPRVFAYWNQRRWSDMPLSGPTGRQKSLYGVLMAVVYCSMVLAFGAINAHSRRIEKALPAAVGLPLIMSPFLILFVLPAGFAAALFRTNYLRALLIHLSMIACAAAVMLSIAVPIATAVFVGVLGTIIFRGT